MEIENRIEKLREKLKSQPFDTLMVLVEENRRYLTGFTGEDTQFDESAGCFFISAKKMLLTTDSRYLAQAQDECLFCEVFCCKNGLAKALPEILKMFETKKLGFEQVRVSYQDFHKFADCIKDLRPGVEIVPSANIVESLRVIKDKQEIQAIRNSLAVAEKVFQKIIPGINPGMTEKQAAWALEKGLREAGADSLAFPSIVASGQNSAKPHAGVTDRIIKSKEPLLFDWGAKINGYCSDISRTIVPGESEDKFYKIFEIVAKAQQKAINAIVPGINSRDVDKIARQYIDDAGFGENFGHGLGHGVGLAVHEAPRVGPLGNTDLKPGMVFTVEPGIYLPGKGGVRLENMVVVTKDGVEVLNRMSTRIK